MSKATGAEATAVDATEIQLGGFSFDPLAPTDFRLTFEGASNTGKSNTMAVLLEDLADIPVPTLIIERLGILSPVRKLDENLIVVGARDEQGIDLAIPIDQVDLVADMVLERGLKVLVDISTYRDLDAEPDKHTEHLAVARVLSALDSRAQERLRAGSRRKCLLFVDEVHYLAPERGAAHIEPDEYVQRARGQLVTVFTEGGNKGITPIVAYQRQAYTSKGVVSQADNRIIHRLHATDRKTAASDLGINAEEIEQLGTGEVLIYGDITDQRVTGPEQVRRRQSPDPREESFELPEPPEAISETLGAITEEIDERETEATQRRDRIDQLEAEVKRLREENAELEEANEYDQRVAEALERLLTSVTEGGPEGASVVEASEDLAAELDDLRERNDRLQADLSDARETVEELREQAAAKDDEIERLQGEVADFEEFQVVREELATNARSILRLLGEADPDAEEARERIDDLREEKTDLQEQVEQLRERAHQAEALAESAEAIGDEYTDFLDVEVVREQIATAQEKTGASPRYVKGVIAAIMDEGGPVSYDEIATRLGVSTTTDVSKAATTLESMLIIEKTKCNGRTVVDLNTEGIMQIRQAATRRERTEQLIEEL